MISKINLKDITFHAFHGVFPQERRVGNQFVVNITLTTSLEKSISSDDLEDTINYGAVYELIKKEMDIPSKLLEHVAGRILKSLKEHFPQLSEIELTLSKINPPVGGDVHSASIILKETYNS